MREITNSNFGLLIAYLLPGFVTLWGVGLFSETVRAWLGASAATAPTVGGFLYVTLGSLAAGMTVSAVRWAVLDTIHHRTGIQQPNWNFARLQANVTAFELLIGQHYRYYQWYANSVVAVAFTFLTYVFAHSNRVGVSFTLAVVLVEIIFWLASRDSLRKYYRRADLILGGETVQTEQPLPETNERRKMPLKVDGPFR